MIVMESFEIVWDAIEDTPEDAAHMKACADLMIQLRQIIVHNQQSTSVASERLRVSAGRVDDLLRGHIDRFKFEDLVGMTAVPGRKVRIEIEAA